ncbi:MAG: FeoB-associated Cys-rich membrane protein [Oscillospiraceae bacterium]|nr:FeoB-associated Cys-rich membrane protein [Oscillospiraceae bacterium]
MHLTDYILLVLIAAALTAAIVSRIRAAKRGGGCCGDCIRCRECIKKDSQK